MTQEMYGYAGRILRVNPAVCRMLGYSEVDLLRLNWKELAMADSSAAIESGDGDSSPPVELTLRHKNGRPVTVQWNVSRVCDAGGRPQYQLCQLVDITEIRKAQEQIRRYAEDLERSNQDLQHFAYVASHDLQEPLRMVRGFMELLARRYEGKLGEDADEYIRFAVDGAARMQNLIRGLGQMGNRMIVEGMGGIGGYLLGGLFGFGMNLLAANLFRKDQKLPIRDDAMDSRIINWDEAYINYAAVRDQSELSYSRRWRESWAAAAARG